MEKNIENGEQEEDHVSEQAQNEGPSSNEVKPVTAESEAQQDTANEDKINENNEDDKNEKRDASSSSSSRYADDDEQAANKNEGEAAIAEEDKSRKEDEENAKSNEETRNRDDGYDRKERSESGASRKRLPSTDRNSQNDGYQRSKSSSYESNNKRQYTDRDRYGGSSSATRSTSTGRDSRSDRGDTSSSSQQMRLKFLMTGNEAGGVIGRGGGTIAQIQSETGARVKISATREMYPGTQSRVGMLEGTKQSLELGFRKVMQLMYSSDELRRISDERNPMTVQFIVPSSIAPALVGHNESNIYQLSQKTNTQITITRKEDELSGYRERLMTVNGSLQDIPLVADEFIYVMSADPANGKYSNPTTMYQSTGRERGGYDQGGSSYGYGAGDAGRSLPPTSVLPPPGVDASQAMQLDLAVPDEQVGVIVGKGGETLLQLQSQSGTRIKISNRGDYVPGTRHRKVTIVGTQHACKIAKDLIMSKIGDTGGGSGASNAHPQNDPYGQGYYQQQQQQQQQQPPPYGQYYGDYQSNYAPPYNPNPSTQSGYDYYSAPAPSSMPYNSQYQGGYYNNPPSQQTDYSHYYASLPPPSSFTSTAPPLPSQQQPGQQPTQHQYQYGNQNYSSGKPYQSSNYYNR